MENAIKGMTQAAEFYAKDLASMSDEQILGAAGGAARKPVDFTYEVALINRRIAARLRGVEPPPTPEGDAFWTAPPELNSKTAISQYMASACQELIDAAKALPDSEWDKPVGAPGREEPAYAMVNFASMHAMYHDAQLNFIQSLCGDVAMHWF
jgi:hypothetical protein